MAVSIILKGLPFAPIDDVARNGSSHLLSDGKTAVLARWDGERFVYPATSGMGIDIEPRWRYAPEARHG